MLKLRVAVLVKRGEQGRARLSRLTVRVQQAGVATVAIGSFGLAGAVALAGTTACSGTAGATRGMPAQARTAADRTPATGKAGPAIKVGKGPFGIAITP